VPLPAVLLWDDRVLAAPTASELVEALGVRTRAVGEGSTAAMMARESLTAPATTR
jgi:hypothetical protein